MKIVDRKTFLAMPAETVFAKYAPCYFEGLMIKGETIHRESGAAIDFFYQQIVDAVECRSSVEFVRKLESAHLLGPSVAMDFECQGRDGCFDEDQLFAVFELEDVKALISRLQRCVGG